MRMAWTIGALAVAFLACGLSTAAADDYDDYYASDYTAGDEPAAASTGEATLSEAPRGSCGAAGCGCCCELECFDCCDYFNCRRRLLGMLPSDHCFDRFVSPLSNPFFFEDPRSLTEVRGIFIDNSLPDFLDSGDIHVWAAQFRGRITDRTSLIVPRLGYLNVNESGGDAPQGFMSTPVGFKYNFIRDVERQFLVSGGITYFIKGSTDALSNFGDGSFHFFLTGGKEIFTYGHWLSAAGFRIPLDNNWGTQLFYWSNQWDYELFDGIYALGGVNWFHWLSSAGFPTGIPVTSIDLMDIPANDVAGEDVVSGVVGVKWKPSCHCEIGSGFEFPLTGYTDILRNRLYVDFILRY